jgi:hypothetical protein
VWAINIFATAVTSSQILSFILDRHRIAQSMGALEGSFFPAFDPSFFQNKHVLKAFKPGSFTSGHRLTSADHLLLDSITPLHFGARSFSTSFLVGLVKRLVALWGWRFQPIPRD